MQRENLHKKYHQPSTLAVKQNILAAPLNFSLASRTLSSALNLPISAASIIDSKNSVTGTLLLSPFHGSTKLATHISFVAVAIFTNYSTFLFQSRITNPVGVFGV